MAGSWWQEREHVPACQGVPDDFFLQRAKGGETKVTPQQRQQVGSDFVHAAGFVPVGWLKRLNSQRRGEQGISANRAETPMSANAKSFAFMGAHLR